MRLNEVILPQTFKICSILERILTSYLEQNILISHQNIWDKWYLEKTKPKVDNIWNTNQLLYRLSYFLCCHSQDIQDGEFKVGLSSSNKTCFTCFNESLLKRKNAFYFILKALFVLKIFKFLSWRFGNVKKTAWLER